MADRLGVPVWAEARHLVEREVGPGGDHEIVVGDGTAVLELDPVLLWMDAPGSLLQIVDAFALHHVLEIDLYIGSFAPADRDPGIRRHEMIPSPLTDDRQPVVTP